MGINPRENLTSFFLSRPPCVVFTACLLAFGITTLILAFYVQYSEVENPDITSGWNNFLAHFAHMDFCILAPSGINVNSNDTLLLKNNHQTDVRNHSFAVTLDFPHTNLVDFRNGTLLKGNLNGGHLKLSDFNDPHDQMDILFHVAPNPDIKCKMGSTCQLAACVIFQGPSYLFPKSHASTSSQCLEVTASNHTDFTHSVTAAMGTTPPGHQGHLGQLTRQLVVRHKSQSLLSAMTDTQFCRGGTSLTMSYTHDPHLTVLLTVEDKSAVNLHLVHTSYFLFISVITVLCWALLRGTRQAAKAIAVDRV